MDENKLFGLEQPNPGDLRPAFYAYFYNKLS